MASGHRNKVCLNQEHLMGAEMIVSVPLFGRRVAPYFGNSPAIVFYKVQQGNIREKWMIEPDTDDPMETARKIAGFKTDVLVCGGIQNFCKQWLQLKGVVVMENQKGEAEQVVESLMASDCFRHNTGSVSNKGGF